MGTTSEKLTYLNTTKGKIKDSINLTGANITTEPFRQYSTKLEDAYIDIINNGTDTLYNNFPKVSGEGTSLTLNNTYQAPMRNNLKGNTSQTGTPTPTNPIPVNVVSGDNEIVINGKNRLKLDFSNDSSTVAGLTFSHTDSTFSLSGTATSTYKIFNLTNIPNIISGETYTLSANVTGTNPRTQISIYFRDANNNNVSSLIVNTPNVTKYSKILDLTGVTNATFVLEGLQTNQSYNLTCELQLEKGEEKTTFTPYQDKDTYNIDLPVENLFDISTITENKYINTSGGLSDTSNSNTSDYIVVKANQTYTLSWDYTPPLNSRAQREIVLYNGSKTFVTTITLMPMSDKIKSFTPTQDGYIRFDYDKKCFDIQLEKGSKANTYTPYGTTPIELCKIGNYQDYFYKDSDKWYLHKDIGKVVLNGSENWKYYNGIQYITSISNYKLSGLICLCSHYIAQHNVSASGEMIDKHIAFRNTVNNHSLYIKDSTYTDSTTFKTWLSTHNTSVYYVLATPTTTEITDTTLINQLEQFYQAQSKNNQTNISQINNDLPFKITASALKKG